MKMFKKLIHSLFGMDLNSETDRREWALAIMGFSFLDEEECDMTENIETAVEQKVSIIRRIQLGGRKMSDMILGGIVAIGLLIYLCFSLMNAEEL